MGSFHVRLPPNIVVGEGSIERVPEFVDSTDRVLIVSNKHLGIDESIAGDQAEVAAAIVWSGEPTVDQIQEIAAAHRALAPTLVIGVGGGSVLDAAKALAATIPNHDHDVIDYLEIVGQGYPLANEPLRVIAAPSTAGTGSEMTKNAVLDVPLQSRKVSLRDDRLVPHAAIVDPNLAAGLPHPLAAACALDAAVQLVESYATPLANPMSDLWALGGARDGLIAAEATVRGRSSAQVRADMAFAASCSGIALANAKLGTIHGFAGVLGGATHIAHGQLCALFAGPVLFATIAALREQSPDHPSLLRYGQLAGLVNPAASSAEDLAHWFSSLADHAQFDTGPLVRLAPGARDTVVNAVEVASSTTGNPVALPPDTLHAILDDVAVQ